MQLKFKETLQAGQRNKKQCSVYTVEPFKMRAIEKCYKKKWFKMQKYNLPRPMQNVSKKLGLSHFSIYL